MKAAVFPVPVWADAIMSLPWSTSGIVRAWIGVGDRYPDSFIDLTVSAQSFSCSKVNVLLLSFFRFEIIGEWSFADTTPIDTGLCSMSILLLWYLKWIELCDVLWGVDHDFKSPQLWILLKAGVAEHGFSRLTGLLSTRLWLAFSKISGFRSPSLPCPWLGCFGSNWVSGDFQSVKGVRRCYKCFTKSDVDLGISVILVFPVFVKWARSKNVWLPSLKK